MVGPGAISRDKESIINKVKIGLLLKSMREIAGISQIDAAAKMGYANGAFVCNVEGGKVTIPVDKVIEYAETYCPADRNMLASSILYCIHPKTWECAATFLPPLLGIKSGKKVEELKEKTVEWLRNQYDVYNVRF